MYHLQLRWLLNSLRNNEIGKVYSLENTDISEVFFMPHHVGHCCTNVIHDHCYALGHSCTVIWGHCCASGNSFIGVIWVLCYMLYFLIWGNCCATVCSNSDLSSHCCTVCSNNGNQGSPWSCRLLTLVGKNAADRCGWTHKVFFTLEREEHLIIKIVVYCLYLLYVVRMKLDWNNCIFYSMKLEESSLRVAYLMIIIEFESCCMNSMPSFEWALVPAFSCSLWSSFIKKTGQPLCSVLVIKHTMTKLRSVIMCKHGILL
jgi:hypothetical protein